MDFIHPKYPTWVSTFGPKQEEINKLLPGIMQTPGMVGFGHMITSPSIRDGSYVTALEAMLATLSPDQLFSIAITAQPVETGSPYPFITIDIPVLHNPPTPHNILKTWDSGVVEPYLEDHQTIADWISESKWAAQFYGFSLGGFGSVVGDTEFAPFPGSGHNSTAYLTDGMTIADIEAAVQSSANAIAYGVAEIMPGKQSVFCIADASHASFNHHNDAGAFASSLFQSAAAAIGAAGKPLATTWESMISKIPDWHIKQKAPLIIQDKEGYVWNGTAPDGVNILMVQRHITNWRSGAVLKVS